MKNIIFDWSGVVKDAVATQLWIVNRIFAKHGVEPITVQELQEKWIQPPIRFYNMYIPQLSEEEEYADYREAILSPECPASGAVTGMVELIRMLKNDGAFLAIVSSDLLEKLHENVRAYGLENVFDEIIGDAEDKTDAVRALSEKHSLSPGDTYFIGDSNHEIEIAKTFGLKSIAVTWGFTGEHNLRAHDPDFVAHTVEELEKIILL